MIKMMTAYTTEIDEIEDGLNEILSQIEPGSLRKNSVGILSCHFDFIEAGFIGKLREKLPFDIIGMTTMASANPFGINMYALSLAVLTSDDVVFETAVTAPLVPGNCREEIRAAYTGARNKLSGPPSMIIGILPYLRDLGGAELVRTIDDACEGTPFWGGVATNVDVSYENCPAFHNDSLEPGVLPMILMRGNVNPEYVLVSIPKKNIRENRGIITGSDGCNLKAVNGIPVLRYTESLGVSMLNSAAGVMPLMVYYEGTAEPVALGVHGVNGDGSLHCAGEMPQGAAIALGEISVEGILSTSGEAVKRVLQSGRKGGALMLPCVTRYMMLAPNQEGEMSLVSSMMKEGNMPFMLGYSCGEICPVRDESGKLQNRYHNYTFSACVLD
ncbi:MAG: FIST C-terminal domain-containing protein [Treponema sp.]|jgi:hypothetical protein|nr:FIST C-terminal domain-containing protein [Treponema sp.]